MGVDSFVKGPQQQFVRPSMLQARDPFTVIDADVTYTEQVQPLGSVACLEDGRKFVFCKNGAVALAAGKLVQSSAPVANHKNIAVAAAAAVGASQVTVTLGATAATANQYAGGYLHVNDAAGEGNLYKILGHPAADASGSLVLDLADEIRVALTTSSEATLTANQYTGLITAPTTLTAPLVGTAPVAVTAGDYFWAQISGPAAVLTNGTVVIGQPVTAGATTAGSVDAYNEDGLANLPIVGTVMQVNASTEYSLINLQL